MDHTRKNKIAVISNPQSGYNRHKGMAKLDALVAEHALSSAKAVTADELLVALKTLSAGKPDILVINGGDGTIDMVVRFIRSENLFEKEPELALIKGGTTNLIHRDVGLRGNPDQALKRVLQDGLRIIERRPLEIQRKGDDDMLYGFFMGTGAVPRAIKVAREALHSKGLRGRVGETLMLAGVLARLRFKRDLESDVVLSPAPLVRDGIEENHVLLALTSLQTLVSGISSPAGADEIGGLYVGGDSRALKRLNYARLRLHITQPWVLDGEMQDGGEIDVRMGQAMKFLVA